LTKIYQADIDTENYSNINKPGTILTDNKSYIKIACNDGLISIKELQMAGKSKMKTKELLNGYNIQKVDNTGE
jgi:methionyl-tRNA formyltransferase